jgi:hypothetical protein
VLTQAQTRLLRVVFSDVTLRLSGNGEGTQIVQRSRLVGLVRGPRRADT